jgi:Fe2+ or Zn2+ uptake regulation protein
LAEDLTQHHHHLLCTDCGKVIDITPSTSFERTLTRYLDELASQEGFAPHSHRVDVLGVCADCSGS